MNKIVLVPMNYNTMIMIDTLKRQYKINSNYVDEAFVNLLHQHKINSFSKVIL